MSPVVQLRPPTAEKPTVTQGRGKNTTYRSREYLTEAEIEKLLTAAGKNRNPNRDRLLVLMAHRHALGVKELVDLQVDQIDLKVATIHIRRASISWSSTGRDLPQRGAKIHRSGILSQYPIAYRRIK
jgi:type 1 fimbriae regulatory protein FimB/type 1 fimbriae regulatory protein FimE